MTKKECEKILNFDLKVLEEASFDYPQCKASKNDYIELSSLLTNNRTQMMLLDPKSGNDGSSNMIPEEKRFQFVYPNKKGTISDYGLVCAKEHNASNSILEKFLNAELEYKEEDKNSLFGLINKYGFLFPVYDSEDVKYEDVVSIIKRLKTVAELITELSILRKSALTDGQKDKHIGSKGSTFEKVLGLTLMLLTCPTIEIQMKNFTYRSYEDNYYRLLINACIPSEEYGSWRLKKVDSDDDMFFDLNTENADFKQWMDNMNMAFGKKVSNDTPSNSENTKDNTDSDSENAKNDTDSNSEDTKDDTDSGFMNKKIDGNKAINEFNEMLRNSTGKTGSEDPANQNWLFSQNTLIFNNDRNKNKYLIRTRKDLRIASFIQAYSLGVGLIEGCSTKGIKHQDEEKTNYDNINEDMRDALINIATDVVKTEINYNIQNVTVQFDPLNTHCLKIKFNTLLEALYYSLAFCYKADKTYKRCEKCDTFFLISLGDSKRTNCGNKRDHNKNSKSPTSNK